MNHQEKIELVSQWIKAANSIIAFTGAGISTPSGIPDFRSEGSGVWEQVNPMEVASLWGFRRNPQGFYDWMRTLSDKTLTAQPNPAHLALAKLEEIDKLDVVITQNIDNLHTLAGNTHILELHGHMRQMTCIQCFASCDSQPVIEQWLDDGRVPICTRCGGVLKPDIILFGEELPYEALSAAKKACRDCDLMLVVGSSLEVAPASDLPLIAQRYGAQIVIIDIDDTIKGGVDLIINGDAADILPEIVEALLEIVE